MLGPGRDDNFIIFGDYTVQLFSRSYPSRVYLEESRHVHFETNLPYLVITRTAQSYEITGLMIDEGRIIMSHVSSLSSSGKQLLTSFLGSTSEPRPYGSS